MLTTDKVTISASIRRVRSPKYKIYNITMVLFILFSFSGCATTSIGRLMPHVESVLHAKHYFGEPASKNLLPSGETRYEWLLDKISQVPGQYVEEKILVGRDRDGYPVYYIRKVFVPPHLARLYCRLELIVDAEGRVLTSCWEGNSCVEMMVVPTTY